MDEIIENLQKQKAQNTNKQNNTYFINRLRAILGKTIEEDELSKIILLKNAEFKKKIIDKFQISRNQRIKLLGKEQV